MKIYLSGPISGVTDFVANFFEAEDIVRKMFPEAEIVNSINKCANAGMTNENSTWEQFMNYCLMLLDDGCTHL